MKSEEIIPLTSTLIVLVSAPLHTHDTHWEDLEGIVHAAVAYKKWGHAVFRARADASSRNKEGRTSEKIPLNCSM